MIYIDRKRIKRPALFSSLEVEKYNLLAAEYFSMPAKKRRQGRFSFKPLHGQPEVRKALQRLFHEKCAYCESQIIGSSPQTIDFFRPMMGTVDLQGHYFTDHYWWLAYEWDNLYSSCPECNRAKGNRFPISAVRAQPKAIGSELLDEKPLLLDPCQDLPEKHLVFSASGEVAGATERGNITIEVLALNRSSLIDTRQAAAKQLMAQWENLSLKRSQGDLEPEVLAQMIESLANDSQSYAGMRRQLITQLLRSDRAQVKDRPEEAQWQALTKQFAAQQAVVTKKGRRATFKSFSDFRKEQDDYSLDSGKAEENYFLRMRMIERIEIHNFRCIADLNLDLSASGGDQAPWLMLLGENGTGKSSVLHAIALALMGTKYRSLLDELDARKYVRHRARKGWVRVYLTGSREPIELSFRSNSRLFNSHPKEPKLLLLGYGATRLLPRGNSMAPANVLPYARIENLFNPFVPLVDATDWLLNLPDEAFQHIARALKELLSLENESMLVQVRGSHRRIEVRAFGDRFALNELSDGYQSVLALATDIMAVMLDRWPAMEVAEGIVLLDEIGAHLHPRWKMRIVNTLRQVFPRVQFIASTHSPS